VADKLDAAIEAYGQADRSGRRERQAHLTLSRSGLINGFNHYLTHGAEFDQHVANELLGQDVTELLSRDGKPRIIQFAVLGNLALDAAHPYFSIEDLRAKGDLPNIIDKFLNAWSYRLAYPDFQARSLKIDCGIVFRSAVPPEWLIHIGNAGLTDCGRA
jgi:hypothetical protein